MMSAVKKRTPPRHWWQELLILWLLFSIGETASNLFFRYAFGWTDLRLGNPFKFLTLTLALAALMTAFFRWQRHRKTSTR
jgi:hypothetical protein